MSIELEFHPDDRPWLESLKEFSKKEGGDNFPAERDYHNPSGRYTLIKGVRGPDFTYNIYIPEPLSDGQNDHWFLWTKTNVPSREEDKRTGKPTAWHLSMGTTSYINEIKRKQVVEPPHREPPHYAHSVVKSSEVAQIEDNPNIGEWSGVVPTARRTVGERESGKQVDQSAGVGLKIRITKKWWASLAEFNLRKYPKGHLGGVLLLIAAIVVGGLGIYSQSGGGKLKKKNQRKRTHRKKRGGGYRTKRKKTKLNRHKK